MKKELIFCSPGCVLDIVILNFAFVFSMKTTDGMPVVFRYWTWTKHGLSSCLRLLDTPGTTD